MGDRKHFSATEDAYDAADDVRREGESWSEYLKRSAKALEGDAENGPETVAVENVDEIARASAKAVEDRLPGR